MKIYVLLLKHQRLVFGRKPISSEAVTARSAASHADSCQIRLLLFLTFR